MIDTRDKRASVLARGLRAFAVYPLPDGVIDDGDREHLALLYRGITVVIFVYPPTQGSRIFRVNADDRVFAVEADIWTVRIHADDRVFAVEADIRTVRIHADDRVFVIKE